MLSEFRVAQGGAEDGGQGIVLALGGLRVSRSAASGDVAVGDYRGIGRRGCTCRVRRTASSASIMARCSGVAISVPVLMPSGR